MTSCKVILYARVGNQPIVRVSPEGHMRANFSAYTHQKLADPHSGDTRMVDERHRVVALGTTLAETARWLQAGTLVHIEGYLRTHRYRRTDEKDDRYVTEVIATSLEELPARTNVDTAQEEIAGLVEDMASRNCEMFEATETNTEERMAASLRNNGGTL